MTPSAVAVPASGTPPPFNFILQEQSEAVVTTKNPYAIKHDQGWAIRYIRNDWTVLSWIQDLTDRKLKSTTVRPIVFFASKAEAEAEIVNHVIPYIKVNAKGPLRGWESTLKRYSESSNTTIRRGRPRIGDAPTDSVRLYARIPSRVANQMHEVIGHDPASLRLALGVAVNTPKSQRVMAYAPSSTAAERDESVAISVVVPRDMAEQIKEIYGSGSPGVLRAFATAIVARRHQRGLSDGKGKLAAKGDTE